MYSKINFDDRVDKSFIFNWKILLYTCLAEESLGKGEYAIKTV